MPKKVYDVEGCQGCPMLAVHRDQAAKAAERKETYFGDNFVPPKIVAGSRLAVGEAPGETESLLCEPFVGGAGEVLSGLYSKAGVDRNNVSVLNSINCRPPSNSYPTHPDSRSYISRSDAEEAVAHCYRAHVVPVLQSRDWKRIDLFGGEALHSISGREGVYKWRGSIIDTLVLPGREIAVPTIHPAALMREQTMFPVVISDLKKSLVKPPERYNLYPSLSELEEWGRNAKVFAFDIENNKFTNEIYMVGLCKKPFEAVCVPFKGPYVAFLRQLFKQATDVVGHNCIQHDLWLLKKNEVVLPESAVIWDTMLMHHLVCPDLPHDLEFVASVFTNKPIWKHQMDEDKETYCCRDTDTDFQVWPQLRALLKQFDLLRLYHNVSVPMAQICLDMRVRGIKLDPGRVGVVREKIIEEQKLLEQKLPESLRTHSVAIRKRIPAPPGTLGKSGKPVKYVLVDSSETVTPWRSDKSVGHFLYEELGLQTQLHVKTGKVTTDKIAIERLARTTGKPELLAIKELRALDETLTTFAKDKMQYGTSIHASFNVHGTNGGRLSSSGPNLQNIPETTRVIYIPHHAGWSIVNADWSGIENRITAWLAHDEERLARLNQPGFSEHKWACEVFFGIPMDQVKKSSDPDSPYSKAKHIVHGTNYGLGPRKASLMYGIPEKEVKQLTAKWKSAIHKTTLWQEAVFAQAKRDGFLTNPFGRKRWFYTSSIYTESLSFLPQSTAADIMLRAMIALWGERVGVPLETIQSECQVVVPLPRTANLLISVHDSLVLECPNGAVDEVVEILTKVMTQSWSQMGGFTCPIEVAVGPSWGECEKYVRS